MSFTSNTNDDDAIGPGQTMFPLRLRKAKEGESFVEWRCQISDMTRGNIDFHWILNYYLIEFRNYPVMQRGGGQYLQKHSTSLRSARLYAAAGREVADGKRRYCIIIVH